VEDNLGIREENVVRILKNTYQKNLKGNIILQIQNLKKDIKHG